MNSILVELKDNEDVSITSRTESEVEIDVDDESHHNLFETILSEISMLRAKHTLEIEKLSSVIQ